MHSVVSKLCVREGGREGGREDKTKIFMFNFLTLREISKKNFGNSYYNRIVRLFACQCFALFCCGYLGAAPIPYIQAAISNMPHSYCTS